MSTWGGISKGSTNTEKRLGLALGSGSALGLAHVGVMSVLDEAGFAPWCFAGSSAGALAAAFCAAGAGTHQMRQIALRLDWRSLQRTTLPVLALSTNEPLAHFLQHLLPVRRFEDLKHPLRIVTTDLLTAEMVVYQGGPGLSSRGILGDMDVVFEQGDLIEAVRASCARPVINHPVRIGGRLLVDGALSCSVPGQLARDMGADVVVAVDLHTRRWEKERPRNLFAYAVRAQAVSTYWAVKHRRIAANVIIRPDFAKLSEPEFSVAEEIIRCGEEAAREALPAIRQALAEAPDPALSAPPAPKVISGASVECAPSPSADSTSGDGE